MPESNITKSPGMQKRKERTAVRRIFIALALSVFGRFAIQHCPQVYITCMSPRNHADCVGNYCIAILTDHSRTLLAQFGLTPKSKRGLAASDPHAAGLHCGISARPSLRACVSDFAPLACLCLRRLYLMELRSTRKSWPKFRWPGA